MDQPFSMQVVTGPASEPVSLSDAKEHLRVESGFTTDDNLITGLISVARERCEAYTRRAGIQATYRMYLDRFPLIPNLQFAPGNPATVVPVVNNIWPFDASAWAIQLPRSPLISVSFVKYVDLSGTLQTLDSSKYIADSDSEPPRLTTATGSYWPSTLLQPQAVEAQFVAGYTSAGAIPAMYKHAMKLLIGYLYQNREMDADMPGAVELLLDPLRVWLEP